MTHQTEAWLRRFARTGYAARGLIYLVIGLFAALAAIGAGEAMSSKDALRALLAGPGGTALVYTLVAGFVFYALWRLTQSWFDTDRHGSGAKGLAIRAGLLASAVAYALLATYSWSLVGGAGGDSGGGGWADTLASFVGAPLSASAIACILAAVGVAHVIKALGERYARYLEAGPSEMQVIHPIAKAGLIARGAVFLILAFLLVTRAVGGGDEASSKAALNFVQALPFGWLLLSMMGVGLMAFAAYSFAEAMYRRVDLDDVHS